VGSLPLSTGGNHRLASQDENDQTGSDDGQNSFGVAVSHGFLPQIRPSAPSRAAEDYQYLLAYPARALVFDGFVWGGKWKASLMFQRMTMLLLESCDEFL
jgi:hypothetical protein